MFWFALCNLFTCFVDLFTVRHLTDDQKDIQILLLRQQVRVPQCKVRQPKRYSPGSIYHHQVLGGLINDYYRDVLRRTKLSLRQNSYTVHRQYHGTRTNQHVIQVEVFPATCYRL